MRDGMTKDEERLARLLNEAGLPRNVARTLAYMKKRSEVRSIEIEMNTGLRQPEVSIAMKYLKSRGWVVKRDIKKEGKGRPVHGYKLAKPFSKIIGEIEKDLEGKTKKIEKLIRELRTFS